MNDLRKVPVVLTLEEAAVVESVMSLATDPNPQRSEVKDQLLEQILKEFPQYRELIDEYRREVGQ